MAFLIAVKAGDFAKVLAFLPLSVVRCIALNGRCITFSSLLPFAMGTFFLFLPDLLGGSLDSLLKLLRAV